MIENNPTNVEAAFEVLLEEIEAKARCSLPSAEIAKT